MSWGSWTSCACSRPACCSRHRPRFCSCAGTTARRCTAKRSTWTWKSSGVPHPRLRVAGAVRHHPRLRAAVVFPAPGGALRARLRAALFGAIAILLMGSAADFEHALEKVEWDSLLFFAGLFVFTEGISELGLLRIIADQLSSAIEVVDVDKRAIVSSVLIQVVAAVASAFVDNIPFTTTMIPVISRMAKNVEGLTIQPLAWALCFRRGLRRYGDAHRRERQRRYGGRRRRGGLPGVVHELLQNRVADDVPVHLRLRAVLGAHDTRGVRRGCGRERASRGTECDCAGTDIFIYYLNLKDYIIVPMDRGGPATSGFRGARRRSS